MSDFSTRFGFEKPRIELAENEMPNSLRSGLWDLTRGCFFPDPATKNILGQEEDFTESSRAVTAEIWFSYYRESVDERSVFPSKAILQIKDRFFRSPFFKVYEFIEFMSSVDVSRFPEITGGGEYAKYCNGLLEREKSQFRFANTTLVKITNENELNEINSAIQKSDSNSVAAHIRRAAELYSQRPTPDYRNSIKESISAVEAAVSLVIGRKCSGVAKPLKAVADKLGMHDKQRQGFEALYGWTSDDQGIRHRLMEKETLSQEDARYMLVSCSAFSNYLLALKEKMDR